MPGWIRSLLAACRARPGWCLAGGLLLLAALAVLPWDAQLQALIHDWRRLHGVDRLLHLARPFGLGEVALLLIAAVGAAGRRRLAAQALTALLLAGAAAWLCKLGLPRARPDGDPFSFCSGDAATACAVLPLLARGAWPRAAALLLAAAVLLGRVVQGYHWPSDVLAGAGLGLLAGGLAGALLPSWRPLADRRWWLGAAAVLWAAVLVKAALEPRTHSLATFLTLAAPAVLAWTAWPWLRLRLRRGWSPPPWAVAAGLAAVLLALAAAGTLWDRDEPRNALAAREMLASGNWLVPTFDGEPRLHKPILPYWLMTAVLRTGLPPDLACRLPAVLAMVLAVWLLGLSARRLVGDGRAASAMLALAASPLVLASGAAATTDAVLLLGLAATMWVLLRTLQDGARWWHAPAAGLAIAWALLAKGPMAVVVPLGTVVLAALAWRTAAGRGLVPPRTWLALAGALAIGVGLAALWFVPADRSLGGELTRVMLGEHVWQRATAVREGHGGRLWYYLPVLALACLAWLPALAAALPQAVRGPEPPPRARLLLLAWFLPPFLAVSLTQTKLPHYLLPALWPLAVLLACAQPAGADGWWRWGQRLQAAVLVLLIAVLGLGVPLAVVLQATGALSAPAPLLPLAGPALATAAGFALLLVLTRDRAAFAGGAALGMAAVALAVAANLWRIEALKPAPPLAAAIAARVPAGVPVATCGFDEPSLYFYLGPERGPIRALSGNAAALRAWLAEPAPGVVVTTAQLLAESGTAVAQAQIVARQAGYNYSNGRAVELLAVVRQAR